MKEFPVKKITAGVFGSLADLLLWQIFLIGTSIGKTGSRGVYQASREADDLLDRYNHRTLLTIWGRLKKKGYISYRKNKELYKSSITAYGLRRLKEIIPVYHTHRPWDHKIYLITFDLPEKFRTKRDGLRSFLKQSGCKMFQKSVWITPYNPRELLNVYLKEKHIPGTVIVSDIGKDGGVGEMTASSLLSELYSLEAINTRYDIFLQRVYSSHSSSDLNRNLLIYDYLSILKDDPQLPFELLPEDWLGDKACKVFLKLQNEYIQFLSRS